MATNHQHGGPHAADGVPSVRFGSDSDTTTVVVESTDAAVERLDLFDDAYARELLQTLSTGSYRGRELADRCAFSRPTVYRRLNRLEDAGLIRSKTRLDPDGDHCKEFELVRDEIELTVDAGTIKLTVRQSE